MKTISTLIISIFLFSSTYSQEYYGGPNGKKLDWVLYYLNEFYVDSTDLDVLTENAIRSMFKELDPYSVYQSKEEIKKQFQNDNGIKEVGIGVTIYNLNGEVIITYIEKDSPAGKTTLAKGDIIQGVNNRLTKNLTIDQIYKMLNGEKDTDIALLVKKPSRDIVTIKMKRGNVAYKSVTAKYMLSKDLGYIKLTSFTLKTVEEFNLALQSLSGCKNLIIDMRANRGGVVDAAYGLADMFLEKDKQIYSKEGKSIENEKYYSTEKGTFKKGGVIALIDGYTASASEIFLGALQEWDRCLIMGTPSFGKGLIQQSYKLEDSSAVRLTIGRYKTPTGRYLQRPYQSEGPWINKNVNIIPQSGDMRKVNIPTDITTKTFGGRTIIKDDGGIHPDIYKVNETEISPMLDILYATGLLYDFGVSYFYTNLQIGSNINRNTLLDDGILRANLRSYLQQKIAAGYTQLNPLPNQFSDFTIAQLRSWITSLQGSNDDYYREFNKEDYIVKYATQLLEEQRLNEMGIKK